jgi:hypothetical protein
VRDAAWGCDWIETPVSFQCCLVFIIVTASKEFKLTTRKFVPVCNKTMLNVRAHIENRYKERFNEYGSTCLDERKLMKMK